MEKQDFDEYKDKIDAWAKAKGYIAVGVALAVGFVLGALIF